MFIKDRFLNNGLNTYLGPKETSFDRSMKLLNKSIWNKSLVLEISFFENWEIESKSNFNFVKNLVKFQFNFLENSP